MSAIVTAVRRGAVLAVQFNGEIVPFREAVRELCGEEWRVTAFRQHGVEYAIVAHPEEAPETVREGDWLVRGGLGGVWVIPGDDFARDYEVRG